MNYIVYKHTAPNGKCYVGMTCRTMERRARGGQGYFVLPGQIENVWWLSLAIR
jgi:hypothetical protein